MNTTTKKGKFIVLYGINNLGKSTQAKLLVQRLNKEGETAEYLKYPIYDLSPSGIILNSYLRQNNPYNLTPKEAQVIYCLNRTQYEKELTDKLKEGIHVVAEDYKGTGIAWGIGANVNGDFLKSINSHLLNEDMSFLFDGERFLDSKETNHKHETDDTLTNKVRKSHLDLAQEYGWIKINANRTINEIHEIIWEKTIRLLKPNNKSKRNYYAPDFKMLHEHISPEKQINSSLKIEKTSPEAKIPTRGYEHDAGLDLCSNDYYSIYPKERVIIQTGIKMAIPKNHVGLVWDKGGIAKSGIHTMAGVVDAGFRGEITINLINLSDDIYNITPGQKIAQILIQKIETPVIIEGKLDDETERGKNRFGSSGLF